MRPIPLEGTAWRHPGSSSSLPNVQNNHRQLYYELNILFQVDDTLRESHSVDLTLVGERGKSLDTSKYMIITPHWMSYMHIALFIAGITSYHPKRGPTSKHLGQAHPGGIAVAMVDGFFFLLWEG